MLVGPQRSCGAVEVVETIAALLPEVVHAVAEGMADPAVLSLPGTRAVAARPGSSKAVATVRQIVAGLPAPTAEAAAPPARTGPRFEEIWPDQQARQKDPADTDDVIRLLEDVAYDDGWMLRDAIEDGEVDSADVRAAVSTLLCSSDLSPARLVGMLEKKPSTLPVLWPLLTEPIRFAGASEASLPRWLNRVLDVALLHADHLREAAHRGLLPSDVVPWPGLEQLAANPGKSAAVTKARSLRVALAGG